MRTPDPIKSWERHVEFMRRCPESDKRWREREAERLRKLYPSKSPADRLVEEIRKMTRTH